MLCAGRSMAREDGCLYNHRLLQMLAFVLPTLLMSPKLGSAPTGITFATSFTMAATIEQLLHAHPTNSVEETGYESSTRKEWTRNYKPIGKVTVHTFEQNGAIAANFDALVPEQADDQHRKSLRAYPPNPHSWRMDTEADARHWFYHEVSDIVMAAFASSPPLVQVAEAKAFSEQPVAQVVDESFTFRPPRRSRIPLVIGEFKRNILNPGEWQRGKIVSSLQSALSRELRG